MGTSELMHHGASQTGQPHVPHHRVQTQLMSEQDVFGLEITMDEATVVHEVNCLDCWLQNRKAAHHRHGLVCGVLGQSALKIATSKEWEREMRRHPEGIIFHHCDGAQDIGMQVHRC